MCSELLIRALYYANLRTEVSRCFSNGMDGGGGGGIKSFTLVYIEKVGIKYLLYFCIILWASDELLIDRYTGMMHV